MCTSLQGISNEELTGRLKQLVKSEKELTHRVVLHLAEFDRRNLYVECGFSTLHEYAVRGLGYSPGSAQRRIKAARAVVRVPEVYELLENGSLSLGNLEVVSDSLYKENAKQIVQDVCGKSREEAEKVLAGYFPVVNIPRDSIKPIVIKSDTEVLPLFNSDENTPIRADWSKNVKNELQYRICITVSAETKAKLERAQELQFSSTGKADLGTTIEELADDYLAHHDPKERNKRRKIKQEKKTKLRDEQLAAAISEVAKIVKTTGFISPEFPDRPTKRYVPRELRDEVLERDGYRCTFISEDEQRCYGTWDLEIDHIVPFAKGGLTTKENLRALCQQHNLHCARLEFGEAHVDSFLKKDRVAAEASP